MIPIDRLAVMYDDGISLRKLSRFSDTPRETLRLRIKSLGVKMRKSRKDIGVSYHKPSHELTEEFAEILAIHAGDGSLDKQGRWCVSCFVEDTDLSKRIIKLTRDVIGIEPDVDYYKRSVIEIRSGQKQAFDFISEYFPIGKKSYIVELPEILISSEKLHIIKSLLRGLMSTDGSFSFKKDGLTPRVEFRVMSIKLRDQFAYLAKKLGFQFCISSPKSRDGVIHTAYSEKIATVLKWYKEIGFTCDSHSKKFDLWLKMKTLQGSHSLVN